MAGTRDGGLLAAEQNKRRYGADYYEKIGSIGGSTKTTKLKGFAAMPRWKASEAGRRGGIKSRRGKA